jgi:hypothetical protein
MLQKETFLKFFDQHPGNYFRLLANEKMIGSNTSTTEEKPTAETAKDKIEKFLEFVQPGEKVTLKVNTKASTEGEASLTLFNTESGFRETNAPKMGNMPGSETSYQAGFNAGYALGKEQGQMAAENQSIKERIAAIENGGGGKGGIAEKFMENLSSSELGLQIMAAGMKKFGLME